MRWELTGRGGAGPSAESAAVYAAAMRAEDPAIRVTPVEDTTLLPRSDPYVAAILQRGERVLSRREAAGFGQTSTVPSVNVTIMSRDAESFRQSRTQVAADIARAVSLGRRGM